MIFLIFAPPHYGVMLDNGTSAVFHELPETTAHSPRGAVNAIKAKALHAVQVRVTEAMYLASMLMSGGNEPRKQLLIAGTLYLLGHNAAKRDIRIVTAHSQEIIFSSPLVPYWYCLNTAPRLNARA